MTVVTLTGCLECFSLLQIIHPARDLQLFLELKYKEAGYLQAVVIDD